MSDQSQGPGWWKATDGKWYSPGEHPGFAPPPPPGSDSRSSRSQLVVAGILTVIAVVACGVLVVLLRDGGESRDEHYLAALDAAGQRSNFAADRAALSNARQVCDALDKGGKPQGSEADKIGVEFYCKDYLGRFKILRIVRVTGTFQLIDFETVRDGCNGAGGYGDINSSTQVVVKNGTGDELARTELGSATESDAVTCYWTFVFEVTEGEDHYIVSVGDRGEKTYTFDDLVQVQVALVLG